MVEKIYLTAQEFLEDSFKLGAMVLKSGFRPSFIIAIWRGGNANRHRRPGGLELFWREE